VVILRAAKIRIFFLKSQNSHLEIVSCFYSPSFKTLFLSDSDGSLTLTPPSSFFVHLLCSSSVIQEMKNSFFFRKITNFILNTFSQHFSITFNDFCLNSYISKEFLKGDNIIFFSQIPFIIKKVLMRFDQKFSYNLIDYLKDSPILRESSMFFNF
jgi:hypothetical protein